MILECPDCKTKFKVPDDALGAEGKQVKCSNCAYQWFQAPIPAEETPTTTEAPPAPAASEEPGEPDLDRFDKKPPKKEATPKRNNKLLKIAAAITGLILVGGVIMHGTVVSAWEPSAKLFSMIGLRTPVLGEGLDFEDITITREEIQGKSYVKIDGHVVNNTQAVQDIPLLLVKLKGTERQTLVTTTVKTEAPRILPIETVSFSTRVLDEYNNTAGVMITFTQKIKTADAL